MGLVGGLLLLPFAGPVWCFRLILERIREEAEAVQHDEGRGFAELIELSMRHKAGKITDAEFAEEEEALLQRLSAMREYREELMQAEMEMAEGQFLDGEPDFVEDGDDLEPDAGGEDAFSADPLTDDPMFLTDPVMGGAEELDAEPVVTGVGS